MGLRDLRLGERDRLLQIPWVSVGLSQVNDCENKGRLYRGLIGLRCTCKGMEKSCGAQGIH